MKTVEWDPGFGWIARSPYDGLEIMEPGFRWNSRSVARTVVWETKILGPEYRCQVLARKLRSLGHG